MNFPLTKKKLFCYRKLKGRLLDGFQHSLLDTTRPAMRSQGFNLRQFSLPLQFPIFWDTER